MSALQHLLESDLPFAKFVERLKHVGSVEERKERLLPSFVTTEAVGHPAV